MNCRIGFCLLAALLRVAWVASPEVQAADRKPNVIHLVSAELGVIGK
jgi:hypothetical protein